MHFESCNGLSSLTLDLDLEKKTEKKEKWPDVDGVDH